MAKYRRRSIKQKSYLRLGAAAAGRLVKAYGNYRKQKSYGGGTSAAPVTSQHEYTTVYKKRRMPARKRKAWKTFVRKTQAVNLKEAPLRTFVYAENNNIYAGNNLCGYFAVNLYGDSGPQRVLGGVAASGRGGMNQMNTLLSNVYGANAGARRIRMESACMELTLKNVNTTAVAIVEMYYFKARKMLESDSVTSMSVESYYEDGFLTSEQGYNLTGIGATTHGTTPFNSPLFTRHFKITKKVRVQLGGGEVASFQIRDPRNHLIQTSDVFRYAANPRRFQGIFLQIYGQPDTAGFLQSNGTTSASVKVMVQQTYCWREIVANRAGISA